MKIDFPSSALLEIDVQNDFCPGGALAVDHGDGVIKPLNSLAALFFRRGGKIIATQDWHPENHVSFASAHPGKNPGDIINTGGAEEQMLWPDHCVRSKTGADFHRDLDLAYTHLIIRKGSGRDLDSYSAFFENDKKTSTGLAGYLKVLGIKSVFLGGLAADYCVFYSAMDAIGLNFSTYIIKDAVRGVGVPAGSVEKAFRIMEDAGILVLDSAEILKNEMNGDNNK